MLPKKCGCFNSSHSVKNDGVRSFDTAFFIVSNFSFTVLQTGLYFVKLNESFSYLVVYAL